MRILYTFLALFFSISAMAQSEVLAYSEEGKMFPEEEEVKINRPLKIKETENTLIRMFPNPSKGLITLSGKDIIQGIRIVDTEGSEIYKSTSKGKVVSLNLIDKKAGIYFVYITYNETTEIQKLHLK